MSFKFNVVVKVSTNISIIVVILKSLVNRMYHCFVEDMCQFHALYENENITG